MKNINFAKNDYSLAEGVGRSYYLLREQGVVPLVAHVASGFNLKFVSSYILYDLWEFDPDPEHVTLLHTTVHIDDVEFTKLNPFSNTGEDAITGTGKGNWDRCRIKFEDHPVFKAIKTRFVHGKSWKQTNMYQLAVEEINSGGECWNGCTTLSELQERCNAIDALYENMAEDGYQSQIELSNDGVNVEKVRVQSLLVPDELRVAVGRNGEIIRIGSAKHRVSIAKILQLDCEIPTIVQIQHNQWDGTLPNKSRKLNTEHKLVEYIN